MAKPADLRSRIIARSNSAKQPTLCIIMGPAGVFVSILSVTERKPAPATTIRSMMQGAPLNDQGSRSSCPTQHGAGHRVGQEG